MGKKFKNIKKGQVISILVCLFIIAGSAAGSITYITMPESPFAAFSKSFTSESKSIYTFLSICIIPYLIIFSSILTFGIAISSVLLFIQAFFSSCAVCFAVAADSSTYLILKTAFLQCILVICCIITSYFSFSRVIRKFTNETGRKHLLRREKIKTNAENIIIFTATTALLVIYCVLKQKL